MEGAPEGGKTNWAPKWGERAVPLTAKQEKLIPLGEKLNQALRMLPIHSVVGGGSMAVGDKQGTLPDKLEQGTKLDYILNTTHVAPGNITALRQSLAEVASIIDEIEAVDNAPDEPIDALLKSHH